VWGLLLPAVPDTAVPMAAFAPADRYELHHDVALRPEPFGALAYHYGSRRLTFLRSPLLVEVVRTLAEHPSVSDALEAGVPPERRPGFLRALASLAESRFIVPAVDPSEGNPMSRSSVSQPDA
jgi:mycofactocin biosynthesis protein MftB